MKKITLFFFVTLFIAFSCDDGGDIIEDPEVNLGRLYVTASSPGYVAVIDPSLPGDAATMFDHANDGINGVMGITIDPTTQMIYSTETEQNRIVRMKADGTGPVEVVYDADDGVMEPQGI